MKGTEFVFNNDATISGQHGVVTMCVSDKNGRFTRDTQRINLKPGERRCELQKTDKKGFEGIRTKSSLTKRCKKESRSETCHW